MNGICESRKRYKYINASRVPKVFLKLTQRGFKVRTLHKHFLTRFRGAVKTGLIFIIVPILIGFQLLQPLASGLCQGDFIRNIPMQYLQRMFPLLMGEWNCSFSLIYIVHYTIFKQARRERVVANKLSDFWILYYFSFYKIGV